MFYKTQKVTVLEMRARLSTIEFDDGRVSTVKNEELSEFPSTKKYNPMKVEPANLSDAFILALHAVRDKVKIRVHFPKHAESHLQQTFSQAGVILPEDIRPLESGKRGGMSVQRDWAAVVWFPALVGVQTPEGTKSVDASNSMNSRRDVVLAILKNGFEITDYTRAEN